MSENKARNKKENKMAYNKTFNEQRLQCGLAFEPIPALRLLSSKRFGAQLQGHGSPHAAATSYDFTFSTDAVIITTQ